MSEFWSNIEIELIIRDYFTMLKDELSGKPLNKAMHRRALLPLLNNRSEGSIEFKHQNISAVLINLGQPYIKGYLPRFNYQKSLYDYVIDFLKQNISIENYFKEFSDRHIQTPLISFHNKNFIVTPPETRVFIEPEVKYSRSPMKINYIEREQKNQKLGKSGEELVLMFEKWNLISIGKEKLSESVEWISQSQGDGAGFDILSRKPDGSDKYIEVKTTKLGKETPFFFTRNELHFSLQNKERYHLYRLFDFEQQARMFIKNGDLNTICKSVPEVYKGFF